MGKPPTSPGFTEADKEQIADKPCYTPTLHDETARPDEVWIRGRCPLCGDDLVSNMYYVGGKGYLSVWECWSSLLEETAPARCTYRRVL